MAEYLANSVFHENIGKDNKTCLGAIWGCLVGILMLLKFYCAREGHGTL